MTAKPLQPLAHNVPIVDSRNCPTPEFMLKWAQQQSINVGVTGVKPGSYADASHVAVITVNAKGQLTKVVATAIVIAESGLSLSDVTTDNVSIARHGFAPKAPNNATLFLDGTGNYSTPGGGSVTFDWNVDDAWMSGLFVHQTDGRTITGLANAGFDTSIRGFASHAAGSGKFYFEWVPAIVDSYWPVIGVGEATAALNHYCGFDTLGWGMSCNSTSFHNNVFTGQNPYVAGDVVGVAVDFTAVTGSVKFLKNNAAQLVDYTGLTLNTMFPMASMRGSGNNPKGKLRLRAAEQTYSPPVGYSPWS